MDPTETELGKLVPFEKRSKHRPAEAARDVAGAEILIFTGVRYQRDNSANPDKTTPSRRVKRKRG